MRFAGPRLAAADDDLVPVKLRRGGRILGGSLSWDKPQPLAAFSRDGPFDGMAVPNDVTVTRQVLAEPDAQLSDRTWATLADGTPLVTAQRRGKGVIVLFHVTADTRWSDLPLSGAFVDMLRRIVALAGATATDEGDAAATRHGTRADQVVPPTRVLDGFGAFSPPPPTAARSRATSTAAPPPIIRPASTARRRACSRSTRWRPPTGRCRSMSRRSMRAARRLSPWRAAGSARADIPRGAGAAAARRAGGVLALRRPRQPAQRRRVAAALVAFGLARRDDAAQCRAARKRRRRRR